MSKKFSPDEHIQKLHNTGGALSDSKAERDAWEELLKQREKEIEEQGFSESALFRYNDGERSIVVAPIQVTMWKSEKEEEENCVNKNT